MKIKHDYVTNSSSTCYILALPENYNPNVGEVILAIEDSYVWRRPSEPDYQIDSQLKADLVDLTYREIDNMKKGHSILKWADGDSNEPDHKIYLYRFEVLLVLMKDLVLTEVEMSSEQGQDRILSISSEKIEKAFFRNNLKKITKTLKKIVQEE